MSQDLPGCFHVVDWLDAQPVLSQFTGGKETTLVAAGGTVKYDGHVLKAFTQNFALTNVDGVWKIVSDSLRLRKVWKEIRTSCQQADGQPHHGRRGAACASCFSNVHQLMCARGRWSCHPPSKQNKTGRIPGFRNIRSRNMRCRISSPDCGANQYPWLPSHISLQPKHKVRGSMGLAGVVLDVNKICSCPDCGLTLWAFSSCASSICDRHSSNTSGRCFSFQLLVFLKWHCSVEVFRKKSARGSGFRWCYLKNHTRRWYIHTRLWRWKWTKVIVPRRPLWCKCFTNPGPPVFLVTSPSFSCWLVGKRTNEKFWFCKRPNPVPAAARACISRYRPHPLNKHDREVSVVRVLSLQCKSPGYF